MTLTDIRGASALYLDIFLVDLYDPLAMPEEPADAHQKRDALWTGCTSARRLRVMRSGWHCCSSGIRK
jgi:hypothetical protein